MEKKFFTCDFFENDKLYFCDFFIEHKEKNMHSHEFWEISYVYEGRGTHHFADGSEVPIKEGEFIFISPGTSHCITSAQTEDGGWVRVCNFLITQEYVEILKRYFLSFREFDEYQLKLLIEKNKSFCIHLKDDSGSVSNLVMTIAYEYKHFSECSDTIIQNLALSLLIYTTRLYEKTLRNVTVTAIKNETIDELIKYIKSNFGSNLSLEYLAAYVYLSPEYVSRYFKKCTGINISDFITRTRIEKAKYRLRTTDWSIQEISLYCGYKSLGNFHKAFKKTVGMTAGEYRKKN